MELLEKFRRHYHRVRKVLPEFKESSISSLKVEFRDDKLLTSFNTPNPDLVIRLAVLMRRFLNIHDDLYYRKIWSYLQTHFSKHISKSLFEEIERRVTKMNQGQIRITVNNEIFTAESIYNLISEGEYFNDDENIKKKLNKFFKMPIIKSLFWDQFVNYTLDGSYLVSALFSIAQSTKNAEELNGVPVGKIESPSNCIYCLNNSGPFTSIEHILPEGLGNEDLILPRGFVCDTCNNGTLSGLDNYLLQFEPLSFLRVLYTQCTKDGKLPKGDYKNFSIKKTDPRNIVLTAKDGNGFRNLKEYDDGQVSFSINFKGKRRFDPKKLGRSLYKIALGMVAFDRGFTAACDTKYDQAREFILYGADFPNNLMISMNGKPNAQINVWHQELNGGTGFAADIFGFMFLLNLQPFPIIELREELGAGFRVFPLHD
ncbi:MAG: hypothetical protein ACYDH2_11470 [Anaerolineaceae bacterium]